ASSGDQSGQTRPTEDLEIRHFQCLQMRFVFDQCKYERCNRNQSQNENSTGECEVKRLPNYRADPMWPPRAAVLCDKSPGIQNSEKEQIEDGPKEHNRVQRGRQLIGIVMREKRTIDGNLQCPNTVVYHQRPGQIDDLAQAALIRGTRYDSSH